MSLSPQVYRKLRSGESQFQAKMCAISHLNRKILAVVTQSHRSSYYRKYKTKGSWSKQAWAKPRLHPQNNQSKKG
jgi:hypothetical protein